MENSSENWLKDKEATSLTVELSVIVPAYNEERRLPPTLIEMIDFLDKRGESYEIIVVNDGSSDRTSEVISRFERIRKQVRQINIPNNRGKGHAVRIGMLNAHGKRALFADADGSTPFAEILRLEAALNDGAEIAFGSRALSSENTAVKTWFYRKAIGRTFNLFVNTILLPGVKDTQCGFKLFTARAAKFAFTHQKIDGYNFDVEVLYIAKKAGFLAKEVPINWHSVPGSKVNLIIDSLKMFITLFTIRVRHSQLREERYSPALSRND